VFHFHVINAQGDIASVERAIQREFQYQSSLELNDETFDAIRHIPLASEIAIAARQQLVERLESLPEGVTRAVPEGHRAHRGRLRARAAPARDDGVGQAHERQRVLRRSRS
jgi:hypothetical protein